MRVVIDTNVVASANKFLECAMDSKCYYIVSGDKDLLTVKEYEGIGIVTVAEFLEILKNDTDK